MSTPPYTLTPAQTTTAETPSSPIVDSTTATASSSIEKSPEVTEEKVKEAEDPVNKFATKIEQDNSIPQESGTTPTPPSRPVNNTRTSSNFLDTTLDGLAFTFSKLDPIAQKLGKKMGQVRQYAEEKFGTAEDITELPQEYKDLEKRVDVLTQLHHNFLKVAKTYNTPGYDYPIQFQLQESLQGFTSKVTNQIQGLSKSVNSAGAQTNDVVEPTTTATNKVDHPKSLSHALGRVALNGADQVGKDEALGAALDKFGTVSDKLGNARLTMDHEIVSKFNTPIQVTLKTSIEGAMKARRQVQVKRLALDAAKTNYRDSSISRLDSARLEVEQAEDQFVGAVEEATHAMKTVLEDPEPLRDLAEFAQIQLAFFKEAQDLFANLVPELEEIRVTQESIYREVVDEQ